jgi:hypothetical protein
MKIKHNKLRNVGILFELLVRRVAADVLDGKSDSFAIKLMREHFHSKTELGKELQLYRTFFNAGVLSENKSFDVLNIILHKRKKLNEKILDAQKFNLIKEIKKHTDLKNFLLGRVPSYKVYASIYKLFEAAVNDVDEFDNIDDVVSARFVVVEHLSGNITEEQILKDTSYADTMKNQPEEIRHLSYKFLLEKFNEKYSNFNNKQKNLLREYINNGTNIEYFKNYMVNEATELLNNIRVHTFKVNDSVTRIKLNEVISQLEAIKQRTIVKDNYITALLIAHQIYEELSNLEN